MNQIIKSRVCFITKHRTIKVGKGPTVASETDGPKYI